MQCKRQGSLGYRGEAAILTPDLTAFLQVAAGPQAAVGIHVGQHPGTAASGVVDHTFQTGRGVQNRQHTGSFELQDGLDGSPPLCLAQRKIELPLGVGVEELKGDAMDVLFAPQRLSQNRNVIDVFPVYGVVDVDAPVLRYTDIV